MPLVRVYTPPGSYSLRPPVLGFAYFYRFQFRQLIILAFVLAGWSLAATTLAPGTQLDRRARLSVGSGDQRFVLADRCTVERRSTRGPSVTGKNGR
jgi:hypothetical protein